MSSFNNPPPMAEQPPVQQTITPSMIDALRKTKPWVRFLSILGFVNSGLIFLLALFFVLGAGMLQRAGSSALGGIPAMLIGFVYVIVAAIYIAPALFLFRYADGIQKALAGDLVNGMEYALKNQKSFWTFAGILTLIVIILVIAVILLAIIVGIAGVAGLRSLQG